MRDARFASKMRPILRTVASLVAFASKSAARGWRERMASLAACTVESRAVLFFLTGDRAAVEPTPDRLRLAFFPFFLPGMGVESKVVLERAGVPSDTVVARSIDAARLDKLCLALVFFFLRGGVWRAFDGGRVVVFSSGAPIVRSTVLASGDVRAALDGVNVVAVEDGLFGGSAIGVTEPPL